MITIILTWGISPALAEWGEPLGRSYSGPEGKPRPISPSNKKALSPEERATIKVFEQATQSVVFITNTAIRRDFWSLNTFEVPQGSGSGFIWNNAGHIVTNFHVIYGADSIQITLDNQATFPARVVGVDPDHDLAVLQIKTPTKYTGSPPSGTIPLTYKWGKKC